MNKLYIVGAGGFAREIYSYLKQGKFRYQDHQVVGFLSDRHDDLDQFITEHKVVDNIRSTIITPQDAIIIAVADCNFKKELYQYYKRIGCKILTYIHPSAFIGNNVTIGEGCVICPYAILTTDITIGEAVTINAHSSIGHDAQVGDFTTLSGHCDVTGFVHIEQSVFLGSHALIIPKTKIESNAIIGAGSVVITKVKTGSTMFGNPAKKIK
ncbi:acetyltransferase [Providencia rettgeri]|uniref:acetyltransferase n=1 Tax=Providencia rettgeri TaxID=587 RepID=UPI0016580975|nr:acetyltransferase [Providencia rettgeri]QNP21741.1 acetyltransferase [Providencia rettgeri]